MTEKRSRVKRPFFRGNPWDQQTSVGFRETPKNYSRFLYWTQHDISFDDLAKQEGISIHTLLKAVKDDFWKHRLQAFSQYPDCPDHIPYDQREGNREERIQDEHLERLRLEKEDQESELFRSIRGQFDLISESYERTTELGDQLNKAAQIAVKSLLSDKKRLAALSVTEIKHLVSLTNDIDTQRSTLSSQAKSLDKLAEHLAITLKKQRARKRK